MDFGFERYFDIYSSKLKGSWSLYEGRCSSLASRGGSTEAISMLVRFQNKYNSDSDPCKKDQFARKF